MAALRRMCTLSLRWYGHVDKTVCIPTISARTIFSAQASRWISNYACRYNKLVPPAAAGPSTAVTDSSQSASTADASAAESTGNASSGGKADGSNKSKWSRWTGKNIWKVTLALLGLSGVSVSSVLLYEWGQPKKDEEGNIVEDEFTYLPLWKQYLYRSFQSAKFFKQMIQDPTSEKLLPDPLREPYYQPPYTLVLEMTGVLIHPDWTLNTGWRFKKRPGLDYFLQQVGPPLFEIVIYTAEQGFTAAPLLNAMDPKGYITYRLFRDSTRYVEGHHVKDLNCLNRDLSKVIIIDFDKKSFKMNPRSGLALKKWTGQDDDKTLYDLASFLRTLAASGVEDVRTVVDYYNHYDDPVEAFRQNQARLQEEEERRIKQVEEEKQRRSTFGLGGLLGSFVRR